VSGARELTLREITLRPRRERFLPRIGGRMGPRNEARGFSEFVSTLWAADGRQRGRRGRRGTARSSVPTTPLARDAPGPNEAAWGPTGRRGATWSGVFHAFRAWLRQPDSRRRM
jgi:hypothetical protein